MFESARLKLTLFYLATILVFSLVLTWGLRAFVQAEFSRANEVQRGAVHSIALELFDLQSPLQSDRDFARVQAAQTRETQLRLDRDSVFLNLAVLVVGGALSYWYAGRTLKPIEVAHERQKRFTADASHELKTPLASMRLENEVFLRQKGITETEARAQVASNLEEVARLERLTASLLELNDYENVQLKLVKLPVRPLVEAAIERARAGVPKVKFKTSIAAGQVRGERESLLQLLAILLDNAVKYGPPKGPIELDGSNRDNVYKLTVRDYGPGISEADLPHIFERMYRGDKARSNTAPGHGIGLSLAQQIASANGARLKAANHPDGGAVFTVSLQKA